MEICPAILSNIVITEQMYVSVLLLKKQKCVYECVIYIVIFAERNKLKKYVYLHNTKTAILFLAGRPLCEFWFCLFGCLYFISF